MTHSRKHIIKKLNTIINQWTDKKHRLTENSNLLNDLKLDSVALLQIIFEVEKQFKITIENNLIDTHIFEKLDNFINLIESKINETVQPA